MDNKQLGYILAHIHQHDIQVTNEIISDLPFALQGMDTPNVRATRVVSEMQLPRLAPPLLQYVYQLCEPAILYKWLSKAIAKVPESLILQAFYEAVSKELQNYLVLIGKLEQRTRSDERVFIGEVLAMLLSPTVSLRLLYALFRASDGLVGGEIVAMVEKYTYHGDSFVSHMTKGILKQVMVPFNDILSHWVELGELNDPFGEFFVRLADPESLWTNRFAFEQTKVPKSISLRTAQRAFDIGKALYFLRVLCKDTDYVVEHLDEQIDTKIDANYKSVIERVNTVLVTKFHLQQHLAALKDYTLLANGNFVDTLMKEGEVLLAQPSEGSSRHHLTTVLETAITTSTAKFDREDVLQCIDAYTLDTGSDSLVYETFSLDYKMPSPLDVIVDSQAKMRYNRVFHVLWQVRWASHSLKLAWDTLVPAQRGLLGPSLDMAGISGQWSMCCNTHQLLSHFTNELLVYMYTQVLESAWKKLTLQLDRPAPVDEIIAAHNEFLEFVESRVLFAGGSVLAQLRGLLGYVAVFCDDIHALYALVQANAAASDEGPASPTSEVVLQITKRFESVHTISADFAESVSEFAHDLAQLDDDSQSLKSRLNYNGYYLS